MNLHIITSRKKLNYRASHRVITEDVGFNES